MKNLPVAIALCAVFASPAVFAQAKNFEGFALQLSTGYQVNQIKGSDYTFDGIPSNDLSYDSGSKGEMPLNIGASYTFALTDRFTLGALIEYNPLSMKTGTNPYMVDGVKFNTSDAVTTGKLENQISLSLVPGYAFTDSTMGYARVGWINATANMTSGSGLSWSKAANGVILGLGAKHLFTENIYGFAEATYANYGGATASTVNPDIPVNIGLKMKPTSYSFLVGVGVRF